jgi:hypothetical protein
MALKNLNRHPLPQTSRITTSELDPVRPLDETEEETKEIKPVVYGVFIALVVLGVITGFVLSRNANSNVKLTTGSEVTETADGKKAVGMNDSKTFKDTATGTVEAGGFEGEGTHKLIREGGDDQTMYMISSVVDLDEFIGQKVTVWGQTMAARNVSWLMDIGKVQTE